MKRYKKLLESIGEEEQVKAKDMLVITTMLSKIISEVDDLKAMLKESTLKEYEDNFEEEE